MAVQNKLTSRGGQKRTVPGSTPARSRRPCPRSQLRYLRGATRSAPGTLGWGRNEEQELLIVGNFPSNSRPHLQVLIPESLTQPQRLLRHRPRVPWRRLRQDAREEIQRQDVRPGARQKWRQGSKMSEKTFQKNMEKSEQQLSKYYCTLWWCLWIQVIKQLKKGSPVIWTMIHHLKVQNMRTLQNQLVKRT